MRRIWIVIALAAALPPAGAASAHAAEHPCARATDRCDGTIEAPLDWSDPASERIRVAFAWAPRRDRSRPADGTILFLGPSRASASGIRRMLGPVLQRQNLLLVDPRGAGDSSPLRCPDLDTRRPATIRACARRLGPRARFFTVDRIAADLNAVHEALGVRAVTVAGGSIGTLYAQAFASRFPASTAAVFLDSVIATRRDGYATWVAFDDDIRLGLRGLGAICRSASACRRLVPASRQVFGRLVRRLRRGPDRRVTLGALASVIARPDDPVLGRELVAAAAAYLRGDRAPLRRLASVGAEELARSVESTRDPALAAQLAADCAGNAMPFDSGAGPGTRRRLLDAFYARRRPAWPFTMREAFGPFGGDSLDACVHWPFAQASPPVLPGARYPAVPALVVGEELDTNTPASNAVTVAASFPRSSLVQVPFAGHTSAFGGLGPSSACVNRLMRSFLARPRHPMPRSRCSGETFRALGSFPRGSARVPPAHGRGLRSADARRAVAVAYATAADALARRHPQGQIMAGLRRERGLRGGLVRFDDRTRSIRLARVRFVADLAVSGTIRLRGSDRASASFRLAGAGGPVAVRLRWRAFRARDAARVAGELDGRPFGARVPLH